MKRLLIYTLATLSLLAVSCNKEDKQRMEELQRSLDQIEGQLDDIKLPAAVSPGADFDAEYAISFDKAKYVVDAGGSVTVKYSLSVASDMVEVAVQGDWDAAVNPTSPTGGEIVLTASDPASPTEIVVGAMTPDGKMTYTTIPVMVRDPYTDATRTYANLLGYYSIKPQWVNLENFQKLADAGLKAITVETEDYNYKAQIELAQQVGLKVLPIVGWLAGNYERYGEDYKEIDEMIGYLKQQPNLLAYHMCDEPSTRDIPSLLMRKTKIESLDPDHPVYINLNPDGSVHALGTEEYRDYIEAYARDCKCKLLSFDMYPILAEGEVMQGWHKCLRAVADMGQKYGVPFWAFAASCWIDREGGIIVRGRPSVENLRLQTYTDLAYGAQVVQFFTIQQYSGTSFAPFMSDGTWTEAYDFLKEACLQVQKRGFVFDGGKVNKITFTGSSAIWGEFLSAEDLPDAIGALDTDKPALVTFVENRGNQYIAIVNQSYTEKLNVTVAFDELAYTIERDGSFIEHLPGEETIKVDEGDLMVIKVK